MFAQLHLFSCLFHYKVKHENSKNSKKLKYENNRICGTFKICKNL